MIGTSSLGKSGCVSFGVKVSPLPLRRRRSFRCLVVAPSRLPHHFDLIPGREHRALTSDKGTHVLYQSGTWLDRGVLHCPDSPVWHLRAEALAYLRDAKDYQCPGCKALLRLIDDTGKPVVAETRVAKRRRTEDRKRGATTLADLGFPNPDMEG